ncbi:imidazolonepropionase-like amidohydrolase [Leucobacter luti]|uniref:metal-dependent hydrolase family protein n=1 Tax=Leucobacter luti TaxID=340320 RepID=UPI0010434559|nr:amidohydrolase family protein [Leucobacter luti]MCW2289394.1 imidazolonepropionase-like amidohydrolase [Leucobacter luti]TCK39954.1 imidazolonepropionase-like amidohydrolase [Leucobacter luti]
MNPTAVSSAHSIDAPEGTPETTPEHHRARLPRTPAYGGSYRLTGATLWTGVGEGLIPGGEIVVEQDRIAYAGPARPELAWNDGPTIDLDGATILPGFIDTHVHLRLSLEASPAAMMSQFDSHSHFHAAQTVRSTLEAGITTARDLGGLDAGYRNAIADGSIAGPRLHLALAVISPTGGHADTHLANGVNTAGDMHGAFMRLVDSDDDMRRTVRELVRSEADVIKVCTTGGVSSPSDTPHDLGVPERQVQIAVDETARRQGQPVTSHAQGAAGILEAIRGGVSSVEHGYEIDDAGIAAMLERGTFLVPTLSSALRVPDPAKVASYLYAKKVRWSEIAREHLSRAITAGVRVAMGTDSGVCPHGRNLTELGHMVDLGMSPAAALTAGTKNAAELLRLDADLGTLEAGKLADLVITRRNPLTEIHALADPDEVLAVVQSGVPRKDLAGLLTSLSTADVIPVV